MGLSIYFGNAASCPISPQDTQFGIFCQRLSKELETSRFVIQRQVHGVAGRFIQDGVGDYEIREHEGDFLVTKQQSLALGVVTADCLPIILYDPTPQALAVIHAGWRGSVAGIVQISLEMLVDEAETNPADVQVFFGPAAKACCYEVQQDFAAQLEAAGNESSQALIKRDGKIYFDTSLFNRQMLIALGINPENINDQYNLCTMCTPGFHSHRLGSVGRQITCAWLE